MPHGLAGERSKIRLGERELTVVDAAADSINEFPQKRHSHLFLIQRSRCSGLPS